MILNKCRNRTDVIMLDMNDSMDSWKETIFANRHTLYPVCDGTADKIIGILNSKDYFRIEEKTRENIMANAVKSAYFVPDTVKADTLFRNMKKGHHVLAVVLDEYGGMSGIITMNDLVEQLVGDLGDAFEDMETVPILKLDENKWEIQGTALLEEISMVLGVSLCGEEYDTFNGYILHELGSIPEDGAVVEVETAGLHISAARIENHQVETAIVHLK